MDADGGWSEAEHAWLLALVAKHGLRHWAAVAAQLPGRTGPQCRERYLKHGAKEQRGATWSMAEDYRLARLHAQLTTGNK
ncbi:hypothetical protein OEZ85_003195 [Tetradesmus obliquus]|uniref:Myb-like domain-containing protein n=1 Tax=Tetradesmus obliquus TaxID=3088 RepID=A0ABY8TZZ2_TETOB|nr:hypothetical protein OEZ85_003195 [Tetradesmus obliquus]